MSNLTRTAAETIQAQERQDEQLKSIFEKHFNLYHESNVNNPGYQAYAGFAVDVCIRLANIIIAIKKPESNRSFRALSDLTFVLSGNEFWQRNSQVLMPMVMAIMSSHRDYVAMIVERSEMSEYAMYDKLLSGADTMPLEIFSVVAFLAGGPELMVSCSLPMKLDLLPIIVGK